MQCSDNEQMIEKLWYGKNKCYWVLIPLSIMYGLLVFIRRRFYRIGVFKSWKAAVPVVVIGNLSVGGNGKTPLAVGLIESLTSQGKRVGLVSRGYGGKSEKYPLLLNASTTTEQAGDEPVLIYQRTGIPVAVSPNRCEAVEILLANYPLDVILTDDGLQHYALKRDVEIVVVDGQRQFGNGWWIPAGPLRERRSRLKSVDMIIVNGEGGTDLYSQYPDKTFCMKLIPLYAVNILTQEKKELSELTEICAIAGISNPNRFFTMLIEMKVPVIKTVAFADHQTFTSHLLADIANQGQTLLMTEKDAVKCRQFAQSNWWYLPIDAQLSEKAIHHFKCLLTKISSEK